MMHSGYLIVETRADHAGRVRIYSAARQPTLLAESQTPASEDPAIPCIRYVAVFDSLDVALMHAQTALRGCLIDVDAGLYRTDPLTAVAAVDAIDLRHQVQYLDPALAADPRLSAATEQRRTRRRWIDRAWTAVGILAILLLLLLGQFPFG